MLNTNNNNTIKTATINTLPKATHQGRLKLDNVLVDVAILDNGLRVISVRSLYKLFDAKFSGKLQDGLIPEFLSAQYLRPYLSDELKELATNKIQYFDVHYNQSECFNVAIIPHIAELFIQAEDSKYIKQRIVDKAYKISATLYLKGMVELIDEVLLNKHIEHKPNFVVSDGGLYTHATIKEAVIQYGDVNITVAVVTGVHVILASDIYKIMGMELKYNLVDGLPAYASPQFIRKHLSSELIYMLKHRIRYKNKQNKMQHGYNVYVIDLLYRAYIKAFVAGDLKTKKAIDRYKRLRKMFLNVSIVGLLSMVDEAVGYERKASETNVNILKGLLTSEACLTHASRYDEAFYKETFRLFKLDYKKERYKTQPVIGKFVNEYVYDTLEVGLADKLKELRANDKTNDPLTPNLLRGYFTKDLGSYVLKIHLTNIINTLKQSETLQDFYNTIESDPLTLTGDRLVEYENKVNFFKRCYRNTFVDTYGNSLTQEDFITWSIFGYYNGRVDNHVFNTSLVESKFIPSHIQLPFGVYITDGLDMFLKQPTYFETIEYGDGNDLSYKQFSDKRRKILNRFKEDYDTIEPNGNNKMVRLLLEYV